MDKVDTSATEGAKALILLNSGAVAAMLGFMPALVSKGSTLVAFKMFGILALIVFLFGAAVAALVFVFQAHGSLVGITRPEKLTGWRNVSFNAILVSLNLFMTSAGLVVVGIAEAF